MAPSFYLDVSQVLPPLSTLYKYLPAYSTVFRVTALWYLSDIFGYWFIVFLLIRIYVPRGQSHCLFYFCIYIGYTSPCDIVGAQDILVE